MTKANDEATATTITNPFDQIFEIAISKGVNGITAGNDTHRTVLALANDSRAGQNDGKHRHVVDKPHHAHEPGRREIWIEGDTDI